MLEEWVDVPQSLMKNNYNRLLLKLSSHEKSSEQRQAETELSELDEEEKS